MVLSWSIDVMMSWARARAAASCAEARVPADPYSDLDLVGHVTVEPPAEGRLAGEPVDCLVYGVVTWKAKKLQRWNHTELLKITMACVRSG